MYTITFACLFTVAFSGLPPIVAFAETTPTDSTTPTTTDPQQSSTTPTTTTPDANTTNPGPTKPTGADSNTYYYNPKTGLWENDHYTWDPATNQTAPKDPVNYSYNPATGRWDTTQWYYNPASGTYEPNIVSTATPPAGSTKTDAPTPQTVESGSTAPDTQQLVAPQGTKMSDSETAPPTASSSLLMGTAPPQLSSNSTNTGAFDLFYNASISNNIVSSAHSGDATVSHNTTGGNATTGNAMSLANIINLLNSTWGIVSGNPVPFIANIAGSVVGDLLIDPGQISQTSNNPTPGGSITINAQANGNINNTVALDATTGNASVLANTKAGNATTGNADAMANVMNLINTSIGTGKSFVGLINIYGDFNGDILLPPGMLNNLLASNNAVAPLPAGTTTTTATVASLNDTQAITNQVALNANSGNATVGNNTTGGNATTGNSTTKLTLFNLTGKQVIGKDALLVFVNVLGSWVGMIMNAPGSTAGLIGGIGTTSNANSGSSDTTINATNTNTITNTITANAQTGNAIVADNTTGGNATTGDATASANILNLTNSNFSLSDWFGILFINVLGNWYGSFGVNTDAGNPVATTNSNFANPSVSTTPQVFRFVSTSTTGSAGLGGSTTQTPPDDQQTSVLGTQLIPSTQSNDTNELFGNPKKFNWGLALIGPMLALLLLVGGRIADLRR